MHEDQVDITPEVVAGLVASQFPKWSRLVPEAVPSDGTVNALFRLGDEIVLRFPLLPSLDTEHRAALVREQEVARRLAGQVPVEVPQPLAIGDPGPGYAGPWAANRWIPGSVPTPETFGGSAQLARDLARFVTSLHSMDSGRGQWNGRSRGGPLVTKDDSVRRALVASAGLVDVDRVGRAWDRCLEADDPSPHCTWIHADLMPANLLMREGQLVAVIDLGAFCEGDPAVDLMPAWNLFRADTRATFRSAVDVGAATWERGRGWAIIQAIVALPYYVSTNRAMASSAQHTLVAVVDEP